MLRNCRPSASLALEEPVQGLFGGGTGLCAFLGRRAAGGGAGGAPAAAQVPRSRIPHGPEQCSKAGSGFTRTARLFG